jgi:hypothetical protein
VGGIALVEHNLVLGGGGDHVRRSVDGAVAATAPSADGGPGPYKPLSDWRRHHSKDPGGVTRVWWWMEEPLLARVWRWPLLES